MQSKKERRAGKSLLKCSLDWYDDKSSRKDSGLSSGDVSDDSESANLVSGSGSSSGCETSCSGSTSTTIGKVQLANAPGKPRDLLMVSVLKKSSSLPVPAQQPLQAPALNAAAAITPKAAFTPASQPAMSVVQQAPASSPLQEEQERQSEVNKEVCLEEYRLFSRHVSTR